VGEQTWERVIALAQERGCALNVVLLACSPEENERRIVAPERAAKRKPQDLAMVGDNRRGRPLLDSGADRLLRLDVTNLSAPPPPSRSPAGCPRDGDYSAATPSPIGQLTPVPPRPQ
jgi:hypothetical protein